MQITPQPDGRLAIIFSAEEDAELNKLGEAAGVDSRHFATIVYEQLMQPSAPRLVELLAKLGAVPSG